MSRKSIRSAVLASAAAAALAVTGFAATSASAATYTVVSPELHVVLDGTIYVHDYDLTYTCGEDGVITFTGKGNAAAGADDNAYETINGMLDTSTNRSYAFHALYFDSADNSFAEWYSSGAAPSNGLGGTATFGSIQFTGIWSVGATPGNQGNVTGTFDNVPLCAAHPTAGNHGQYVSGAVKAGKKGGDLAAIAKDVTLVGPYIP